VSPRPAPGPTGHRAGPISTDRGGAAPSLDTITVDLTIHDVAIIAVALSDAATPGGDSAWAHPRVERLRLKLADAITRRIG